MIRIRDSYRVPGKVTVTWLILALNFLSFWVIYVSMNDQDLAEVFMNAGVVPLNLSDPSRFYLNTQINKPPPFITTLWAQFLHGGIFHLIGNMFWLYLCGPNVEAKLGRVRFLFFYLACGTVGMLCQALVNLKSPAPIIGASGAISGLIGAYWVLFSDHMIRLTIGQGPNYRDFIIPIKGLLVLWLITQIAFSIMPDPLNTDHTAYFTHLGGFACGFILAYSTHKKHPQFKVYPGGQDRYGPFGGVQ